MSIFPDELDAKTLAVHLELAIGRAYAQIRQAGIGREKLILTFGVPLKGGGGVQAVLAIFPVPDQAQGEALGGMLNQGLRRGWKLWKDRQNYPAGWGQKGDSDDEAKA